MPEQLVSKVFAHDAVDQHSYGRVQGHGQTGDHAEHDEPELRGETVDLAHVHSYGGVVVGQGLEEGHVVRAEHETKFLLKKKEKRLNI